MEERVVVELEAVGALVDAFELRLAQEIRPPEEQHAPPKSFLVERKLVLVAAKPLALVEQFCDFKFPGQRALAPDFGRMGGKDRAHQRMIEEVGKPGGLDAHFARALERIIERAGAWRGAGDRMSAVAADVMLIFGDVGEMGEIAVGARDRERLVSVEAVERRLELAPRADLVVAMEPYRGLADLLDQLENLFALLLPNGVTEDSTEQADVVAQWGVLLGSVRGAKRETLDSGGARHWAHPLRRRLRCCTAEDFGARPKDRQIRRNLSRSIPPSGPPRSGR